MHMAESTGQLWQAVKLTNDPESPTIGSCRGLHMVKYWTKVSEWFTNLDRCACYDMCVLEGGAHVHMLQQQSATRHAGATVVAARSTFRIVSGASEDPRCLIQHLSCTPGTTQ